MSEQKQIIKIQSEYLNGEVSVGVIVPAKIEKFLLLLHGYNGSFQHLEDNLPLTEYANGNNMIIAARNCKNVRCTPATFFIYLFI